jgi:hypothetical protein
MNALEKLQRFAKVILFKRRLRELTIASLTQRHAMRMKTLRAAVTVGKFVSGWIRKVKRVRAANKISKWYKAYLPLVRIRRLRKGFIRLQVTIIIDDI